MTTERAALLASYLLVLMHLERCGGWDRADWIKQATGAHSRHLRAMRDQGLVERLPRTSPVVWAAAAGCSCGTLLPLVRRHS